MAADIQAFRHIRLLGSAAIVLTLAGCFSRDPQPGDIPAGSMGTVAANSEGGGDPSHTPLQQMKTTELRFGPSRPGQPYRYNEKLATVFFYESEMGAEDAVRGSFFVSLVVRPGQWAITKSRYGDNLNLSIINNMKIDENGRVVITAPQPLDADMTTSFRTMGSVAFPFTPGTTDKAVSRTTVVYPDGRAESSITPMSSPPIFDANTSVKQVLDTVNAAKQQAAALKAQSANSPAANMQSGMNQPGVPASHDSP